MSNEREGLRERIARELWGSDRGRFWPPANDLARDVYLERADRILALLTQAQEPVAWAVEVTVRPEEAKPYRDLDDVFLCEDEACWRMDCYIDGSDPKIVPLIYASPVASAPEEEREAGHGWIEGMSERLRSTEGDGASEPAPTQDVEALSWRPWDTCPKDGRAVLARFDHLYCETVCRTPDGWYWYEDGDTSGTRTPTHWMPIPALSQQGVEALSPSQGDGA